MQSHRTLSRVSSLSSPPVIWLSLVLAVGGAAAAVPSWSTIILTGTYFSPYSEDEVRFHSIDATYFSPTRWPCHFSPAMQQYQSPIQAFSGGLTRCPLLEKCLRNMELSLTFVSCVISSRLNLCSFNTRVRRWVVGRCSETLSGALSPASYSSSSSASA